jgi:hypothetical protein
MAASDSSVQAQHGGCSCRHVRYRITGNPLFVN